MKKICVASLPAVIALLFIPALAEATSLSDLTGATVDHSIDNGSTQQQWHWHTQSGNDALILESNTSTAYNGQTILHVLMDGSTTTSGINSWAAEFTNSNRGPSNTNYGVIGNAQGGSTHNYSVYGQLIPGSNAGDAGVWGDAGTNVTVATYGIYGTNESAPGYAGYFKSTAGYAAAFIGGNVGIGTATPLNLLDIGTSGGIHIASGVPGSTSMALYNNAGTLTWNGTVLGTGSSVSGTTNYIPVFTGSSSLGNSVIYQGSGNVGIGTTSPISTLNVNVASGNNGIVVTNGSNTSADYSVFGFTQAGINEGGMYSHSSNLYLESYNGPLVVQGTTGQNVGIGITSPSYTLQVNGSVAGTSAYVNTSDVRRKKNIQPLDAGLKEVEQLRPVTFEWNDDILNQSLNGKVIRRPLEPSMQGKQIGLIAQDVEKILPSVVVTEANTEKTKGMKYAELIPVLIKAMQEQQVEIEKLKQMVEQPTHH
jgi:hypothetical protein